MKVFENVLQAIGETPLIRLNKITAGLPVELYVKAEFVNPGGSVKDRIGLALVEDAERQGLLKPGGTIIEATAGNTGVGLALAAAVKGYRCLFVLPDKMSEEKINLLRAYGAEVVITSSSVAPDSPDSYNGVAERLAREIPGAYRPNQFGNAQNPAAHYRSTGPEIWQASAGKVDVFVAGMGTGGTISGTGKYLKEKNPKILVIGADPEGSILSGDAPKSYKVEGIGEDFIPSTFDRQVVDDFVRVSDQESFRMARRLAREEGLLVGGSSGTAVAAALKYARRLPPGKIIVALLPDTGRNYLSKFHNDAWMSANGFSSEKAVVTRVGDVVGRKKGLPALVSISPKSRAIDAVELMNSFGISQLPVLNDGRVVGALSEVTLLKLLSAQVNLAAVQVAEVMGNALPEVDVGQDIAEPYRLLMAGHGGVVVTEDGMPKGFLSRFDLVRFWSDGALAAGGGQ